MKVFIELLQNISRHIWGNIWLALVAAAVAIGLATAQMAHAQTQTQAQGEEGDLSGDLSGEVLTEQQAKERLTAKLLDRAFGWSEMQLVPSKLTVSVGTIGTIYIQNKSSQPRDFRILIEEPEESAPDMRAYMRYGPRSFRLQPTQTQVVKIVASPNEDAPPFRQRFSVQMLPFAEDKDDEEINPEELTFRLRGVYAISMPVDVVH